MGRERGGGGFLVAEVKVVPYIQFCEIILQISIKLIEQNSHKTSNNCKIMQGRVFPHVIS